MVGKNKILIPGEFVTTEEEYASGKNTYPKNGQVLATNVGIAEFDETNKEVRIKGHSVEEISEGDIVYGQVNLVKENTAVAQLLFSEKGKKITGFTTATLQIRNVSNEYVTELRRIIKIGDIIKARVIVKNEFGVDLTTKDKGLGVCKAYCTNCRKELIYSNSKLMCLACGNVEERKWFEADDAPREKRQNKDYQNNRFEREKRSFNSFNSFRNNHPKENKRFKQKRRF